MLNLMRETLPVIPFSAQQQSIDLPRSVYMERLDCTIAGTIDIAAGGGADGTLLAEHVARLIREVTIKWDTFDLVQRISGRDLVALAKRGIKRAVSGSSVAAVGVQTTPFSLTFPIFFARPWLVNPFDTVLPPLTVASQFKMYVTWETSLSNAQAGTVAGSGAFLSGGTRAITFPVAPSLTVVPKVALRGKQPWFIPVITSMDSEQFSAANGRLTMLPTNQRRFDSVLIALRQGATQDPAELLTDLSFQSAGTRYLSAVPRATLHESEQHEYPAVGDGGDDAGYFFLQFADGGWLGNVVEPSALSAPRFELNVVAPGSNPGFARFVFNELLTHNMLTAVKG